MQIRFIYNGDNGNAITVRLPQGQNGNGQLPAKGEVGKNALWLWEERTHVPAEGRVEVSAGTGLDVGFHPEHAASLLPAAAVLTASTV